MLKAKGINRFCLLLLMAVMVLVFFGKIPLYNFLLVLAFWSIVTIIGATNIRLNYFISSLNSDFSTEKNNIALTFDDGPTPQTLKILALLEKHGMKATFFCIGHCIDEHPEIFKKIIENGHCVGNHTYSHAPNMGFLSTKNIQNELEQCNAAAKSVIGKEMRLYRPPFGVINPKIRKALEKTGHITIGWSLRSFDGLFTSEKWIYKRIQQKLKKGDVILLHGNKKHTLDVLKQLLPYIETQNLKSVSIDEFFKLQAYR